MTEEHLDSDSAASQAPITANVNSVAVAQDHTAPARPSAHRAPPMSLPEGRAASFAVAVATIQGHDMTDFDRSAAIEWVNAQVAPLLDPTSDESIARLACHVPLLDSLVVHFSKKAARMSQPDHAAKMVKVALQAQAASVRTIALIAELKARQPRPVVNAEGED